jgi:hypothetical protein
MSRHSKSDIIAAYIERFKTGSLCHLTAGKSSDESTYWAFDEVSRMSRHAPKAAFALVLDILKSTDDANVLAVLAAGPLEHIIEFHGELVIDDIEAEASTNSKFLSLLLGVWRAGSPEVWRRIERLIT